MKNQKIKFRPSKNVELQPTQEMVQDKSRSDIETSQENPTNTPQKRILVLDLDETLVHCKKEGPSHRCDKIINIVLPDNQGTMIGLLNFRPHVFEFLKKMKEYYDLVVYTASHECYATIVVDLLDPKSNQFLYKN